MLRQRRSMARSAAAEVRSELPPELAELDLRSMSPRNILRETLFDDQPIGPLPERPSSPRVDQ